VDLSVLAFDSGWGNQLLRGLLVTISLGSISMAVGVAIGLATALIEIGKLRFAARLVAGWNWILRSLPELLVIFAIYYGLSFVLAPILAPFGFTGFISVNAFWAGVIAIGLIIGAYCGQVFRGAFAAVPRGPVDAARALGLRETQVLLTIWLPLAFRYGMPGLINLLIVTLKITPLVSAIGLQDLMRVAGDAGQNTKRYMTFYVVALVLYLLLAAAIAVANMRIEKRVTAYRIA
jgi:polar amino acid transport system permease protein